MNNTENNHAVEQAEAAVGSLEKFDASAETLHDRRSDFEQVKSRFLRYISEAKDFLSETDNEHDAARIAQLEERFSQVMARVDGMASDKKARERAVLGVVTGDAPTMKPIDALIRPMSSDGDEEGEDEDITIEDDRVYRKPLKEAYAAYENKDYRTATVLFEKAAGLAREMKRMGKFAEGMYMRSQCMFDQGNYSAARKAFEGVEQDMKKFLGEEDVPKYYYGSILRKALCSYNLQENAAAVKVFLDAKLMERALPFEDSSTRRVFEGVIADLRERGKKK